MAPLGDALSAKHSAIDIGITLILILFVLLFVSICSCCKRKKGRYTKGAPVLKTIKGKMRKGEPGSVEMSSMVPSVIMPSESEMLQDQEEAKRAEIRKSYWTKKKVAPEFPSKQESPSPLQTKADLPALQLLIVKKSSSSGKSPLLKLQPVSSKKVSIPGSLRLQSSSIKQVSMTSPKGSQRKHSVSMTPDTADLDPETRQRLRLARHPTAEEAARSLNVEFSKESDRLIFVEYYGICKETAAEFAAKRSNTTGQVTKSAQSGQSETSPSKQSMTSSARQTSTGTEAKSGMVAAKNTAS